MCCISFQVIRKKRHSRSYEKISSNENLKLVDKAFDTIYESSEGDCRRAINLLQATASVSLDITSELVSVISSAAKPADIRVVLD